MPWNLPVNNNNNNNSNRNIFLFLRTNNYFICLLVTGDEICQAIVQDDFRTLRK